MALPTVPAVAFRLMAGVTVYIAQAEFSLLSDAVTVWIPAVLAGTVNAQWRKLPLASVVQSVETLLPSKLTVMGSNDAKPLPLTAAPLPTAPPLAVRPRAALTVKMAVPEFV